MNQHYSGKIRDKSVKERTAFSDHPSCARFFFLTATELESIVHFAFLMQNGLFFLDFANTFLLCFECLDEKWSTLALNRYSPVILKNTVPYTKAIDQFQHVEL